MRHHSANAGRYELVARGIRNEADVEGQIRIVEQMMAQGVSAIVIAPADSRALVPICRAASDEGIVIVNIDNRLDAAALGDKRLKLPFVGPDNRAGAAAVGAYLASKLQAGDKVAIIEGVPTAYNAVSRTQGFLDAMRDGGMKVVGIRSGYWELDKANAAASALLGEFPDLRALLCGNDNMALGVLAAVRALGRTGEILVSGFDDISAARSLVRQGKLLETADQHADRIAVAGIELALSILAGGAPHDIQTPVDIVTR